MPITFDTLAELKAFYRDFRLTEKMGKGTAAVWVDTDEDESERPRRGRPPRKQSEKVAVKVPGKRGRKPKANAEKPVLKRGPKAAQGETLTSKIQASIQGFLDVSRSFTANDVYDDLAQKDSSVNKQSVITSVLKQMNSTYKTIAVTERPGNGPRPVKLYNP